MVLSIPSWPARHFNLWLYFTAYGMRITLFSKYRLMLAYYRSPSCFVLQKVFWLNSNHFLSSFLPLHSVSDNDDLATHASTMLVRMCGVTPPVPLVGPLLDAICEAITTSPVTLVSWLTWVVSIKLRLQSWKVRLKALPLVQGLSRYWFCLI